VDLARFPRLHRVVRVLVPAAIGLAGAWLGMLAWGRDVVPVGPFGVALDAGFGRGVTDIDLPPFGRVTADTHVSPLRVRATWEGVHVRRLTQLLQEGGLEGLVERVEQDLLSAVAPFAIRVLVVGLAGAGIVSAAVFRRNRRAIEIAVAAALVSLAGSGAVAAATYQPAAFLSPTFSGPLTLAPQLIGPVRAATARFDYFREELRRVVDGIVRVYTSVGASPLPANNEIRILHISDVHLSPLGFEFAQELARGFDVDAVIDTGDATSFGTPAENLITRFIPDFGVPYVFVRGNHDSRSLQAEVSRVPNAVVLDGNVAEVAGLVVYGLGHPVFLKHRGLPTDVEAFSEEAHAAGEVALGDVEELPHPPDMVAVHDDRMAEALAGRVPLVVSGHFHEERAQVRDGTLYLQVGTTGGAGLETFTREGGIPLSAEILYFRAGTDPALVAYDTIRQFPESGDLTIERNLVPEEGAPAEFPPSP